MNIAVILSGGVGKRFGGALPKQFTKLAGKAIIEYTISVFQSAPDIDEIIVVSHPAYNNKVWDLAHKNDWNKISKVVTAGQERFDSTHSALQALNDKNSDTKVLFHDAVRPLVDHRIISDCIEALDDFEAVDVVIESEDTIVKVLDDNCIDNIPNRATMRRGQTPQAFRLGCIRKAYDKAIASQRTVFTCDCGVVRAMLPYVRVATVKGSTKNRKVTRPMDLFITEKFLQESQHIGASLHNDLSFLKDKNIVIFGGSSGIGKEMHNLAINMGAKVETASRSFNKVDICNPEQVNTFMTATAEKLGHIDYAVNSVGYLLKKPLDLLTQEEIQKLININYTGAVNVAIAAKPYLKQTTGMLLNFTSSSYTRGRANYALYSSTNAAIVNFTQAIAEEWTQDSIRVNCINPERTATPMRTSNFGVEPPELLLNAKDVATVSLKTLASTLTGTVVDVRKDGR